MTQINYYYAGAVAPTKTKIPVRNQLVADGKLFNPVFNFDQSFVTDLQSVSPTELGQSVPFVSLKIVGLDGLIKDDLNVSFFHKPLEMESIRTGLRFSDRNVMSLQDLELTTDRASGYLYYTNVTLKLKIHKPDALTSSTLISLLFPGMPLLLEYGWNSPNEFLNQREKLLFSVVSYDLSMDTTGQIDLSVNGKAFNDRFNNTLIGDDGKAVDTNLISNTEFDGLAKNYNQVSLYLRYLESIQERKDANINDNEIIKSLTENFRSIEEKARNRISTNFSNAVKKLDKFKFNQQFAPKLPARPAIRFHDILHTLCNDTFAALNNTFPNVKEFRVIYGAFNDKTPRSGESIAEFPIDFEKFKQSLKECYDQGQFVPTISNLLNILIRDFVNNTDYWQAEIPPNSEFNEPNVVINFYNNGDTFDLSILDIKNGVPSTTSRLPVGRSSPTATQNSVLNGTNLPVIVLGHANSFIKEISLSQISDAYMKAALITRMAQNRTIGPRSTVAPSAALKSAPVTPLTLPLRGTASVLGHPGWKPLKAFYLNAGIFVVNAIYVIDKVTHKLTAGRFDTQIEFRYN